VGLAFAEQLVQSVPVTDHDELLEGIATDREVIGLAVSNPHPLWLDFTGHS
jgi:5-formyltetrahydrofolate cyclo-ligase